MWGITQRERRGINSSIGEKRSRPVRPWLSRRKKSKKSPETERRGSFRETLTSFTISAQLGASQWGRVYGD